jgi:GNAT superfamily N-acetyltransferase
MSLHLLDATAYGFVKDLFSPIPGTAFLLEAIANQGNGKVFADSPASPRCAYLETGYGFYYFAGAYDEAFLKEALAHIFTDIVPAQTLHPYLFAFGSDKVWLKNIKRQTRRYKGFAAVRRLYHLTPAAYRPPRRPDGFRYALEESDADVRAVAYDGDTEAAYCGDGGRGAGMMDLDTFVHEAYRHRGLGAAVTSMMAEHCFTRGVMPQGGIWAMNEPSWRMAEKMGFIKTAEFEAYIAQVK